MTACAYRSLEPVLVQRVAELRERRERDAMFVGGALRVAARRVGRSAAGAVGVAMALAAFACALLGLPSSAERLVSTELLILAWPAALVAGVIGRLLARLLLSLRVREVPSGDPGLDLARLEATDPLREARDVAMSWERRSTALPLAAVSLLAPLTIHLVVWFALSRPDAITTGLDDYGTWIALSVVIVGHAHLALLVCAVRWAYRLRTMETLELQIGRGRGWGTALLVSGGLACLPGIVLLAIPPLLVLVTGLAFVPLMYHVTARTLVRERQALEAA
jgi:hypothetical protein